MEWDLSSHFLKWCRIWSSFVIFLVIHFTKKLWVHSLVLSSVICGTIGGIHLCGCGWVPVRRFLCLFWHETHIKGLRVRLGEDEGKQGSKAVNRREANRAVSWREQTTEVGVKPTVRERRLLGPVGPEARLANVRGWVSIPGGGVGISFEYTLVIAHRCTESYAKVSQTSPFLRLELTQVRDFLFSFLPPS